MYLRYIENRGLELRHFSGEKARCSSFLCARLVEKIVFFKAFWQNILLSALNSVPQKSKCRIVFNCSVVCCGKTVERIQGINLAFTLLGEYSLHSAAHLRTLQYYQGGQLNDNQAQAQLNIETSVGSTKLTLLSACCLIWLYPVRNVVSFERFLDGRILHVIKTQKVGFTNRVLCSLDSQTQNKLI